MKRYRMSFLAHFYITLEAKSEADAIKKAEAFLDDNSMDGFDVDYGGSAECCRVYPVLPDDTRYEKPSVEDIEE